MIGAWLIALVAGLVATFVLNWIFWVIPYGFIKELFAEFGQVIFVPLISMGIGYIAGSRVNIRSAINNLKIFVLMCIFAAIVVSVSSYYFGYLSFKSRAIPVIAQEYQNPEQALDNLFISETGQNGFVGYLLWSAGAKAEIESVEVESGGLAALINWGKRLIGIIASVILVRYGLYSSLTERIKTGRTTGQGIDKYFDVD